MNFSNEDLIILAVSIGTIVALLAIYLAYLKLVNISVRKKYVKFIKDISKKHDNGSSEEASPPQEPSKRRRNLKATIS